MKKIFIILAIFAVALTVFAANPREVFWENALSSTREKPKTALLAFDELIAQAAAAQAWDEYALATILRSRALARLEGRDGQAAVIRALKAAAENTPGPEARAFIDAELARAFTLYAGSYDYGRMKAKTPIAVDDAKKAANDEAIETWSRERLLDAASEIYMRILADAEMLKKIPIRPFLAKTTTNASLNKLLSAVGMKKDELGLITLNSSTTAEFPTLYDFFAQDAIDFYTRHANPWKRSMRHHSNRITTFNPSYSIREIPPFDGDDVPENAFTQLPSVPELFGSTDEFAQYVPVTEDKSAPLLHQLQILQAWEAFHKNDAEKSAFARAKLTRILWAFENIQRSPENSENYKTALARFAEEFSYFPIAAEADAARARCWIEEKNNVQAHLIASASYKKHAGTPNAFGLVQVLNYLEEKDINNQETQYIWANQESATLTFSAKNISKIYCRVVRWDWNDFLRRERNRPESLSARERKEILLAKENAIEWSQEIDTHNDFCKHEYSVSAPLEKLTPGFYFVVISAREDFAQKNNDIAYLPVWVSNLALVVNPKTDAKSKKVHGRLMNAISGEPVEGATVAAWNKVYGGDRVAVPSVKTDVEGNFTLEGVTEGFIALATTPDGNAIDMGDRNHGYYGDSGDTGKSTDYSVLFTDRAIYRPGQSIQFKGILAYHSVYEFGSGKIIPGKKIEVSLIDNSNGRTVEKIDCYSNAFGSFAGAFTAPANALTGSYAISFSNSSHRTYKDILIEEYKRPKFAAEVELPKEEVILGGNAYFTISAKSFTGAPINGAKVEWKIQEQPVFDRLNSVKTKMYKSHGTGTLDDNGKLKITFPTTVAKLARDQEKIGKLSAEKRLEAEYGLTRVFELSVTITDSNGETREEVVRQIVGNSSLKADLSCKREIFMQDEIPEVGIRVSTRNDNLKSVPVKIEVFKCDLPEKIAADGKDLSDAAKPGEKVFEKVLTTNADKEMAVALKQLPAGGYLVSVSGKDRFEKPFKQADAFRVVDLAGTRYPVREAFFFGNLQGEKEYFDVGETCTIVWGSGHETARAYIEISHKGKTIKAFWTDVGKTQQAIRIPVTPELVGGFAVHASQVRDNRLSQTNEYVTVNVPDKKLKISLEKFRTKLIPGGAEIWTAKITDKNGAPAKAEMVATLYDKSLDTFAENLFPTFVLTTPAYYLEPRRWLYFSNTSRGFRTFSGDFWKHRNVPYFSTIGWTIPEASIARGLTRSVVYSAGAMMKNAAVPEAIAAELGEGLGMDSVAAFGDSDAKDKNAPLALPRKNLQETAFFYPFLNTDSNGVVTISFIVPEALTGWRFLAFAHDTALRSELLNISDIVTSKDLMVQPNAPRFLREGDELFFPVKITNTGKTELRGNAKLSFSNLETGVDMSAQLGVAGEHAFAVPANSSKTFLWKVIVPDGCPFLSYRATASAGMLSDGEENFLPVLPRKITLTESVNVPIRGNATETIALDKLLQNTDAKITSHSFSIQATSNPVWSTILALPKFDMQSRENESSDSIFFRYYANALAENIANSDPKIRAVFERWRNTAAIESPLAKDEQIKRIALEETPYWQDAQNETAQRRGIGEFFDANKIGFEKERALKELRERLEACHGAGWSWFPGRDTANDLVTHNILLGFARLRRMGVATDMSLPMRAVAAQDEWLGERFDRFDDDGKRIPASLGSWGAGYLYMRSFYHKEVPQRRKDAWEHYIAEAKNPDVWIALPRMSQAHIAIALLQIGGDENLAVAKRIAESVREHATQTQELGAFWKDERTLPWWCWNYSPIETQAMMIELFERVAGDKAFAEEIRINLLTQKQANTWGSTRATADAIWAIFGEGMVAQTSEPAARAQLDAKPLKLKVGTQQLLLKESGPGMEEKTFLGNAVVPALGKITVTNPNENVAWAAAHWTFSQDIDTVSEHGQNAMKLRKTLWKKSLRQDGTSALFPIRGEMLEPGDELIVRLTIETDRDFEFVHMKDYRGSGTEPSNALSGWHRNNAVWYYETPRDTATHFFFDRLPAGTHVFEYSLRVQQRGKYTGGITELRSLYAPEFNAHSSATNIVTR